MGLCRDIFTNCRFGDNDAKQISPSLSSDFTRFNFYINICLFLLKLVQSIPLQIQLNLVINSLPLQCLPPFPVSHFRARRLL